MLPQASKQGFFMKFGFKLFAFLIGMLTLASGEARTTYSTSIFDNEARDPYIDAIQHEDIPSIQSLIHAGVDINHKNKYGYTPLMAAVYKGNVEICRILVNAGAHAEAYDNDGQTLLFFAVYDSEKETVVRYLIDELHVNVNLMSNSETTPLILAALNNHKKSLELLISAGAKMETKGKSGGTALFHAAGNNSVEAAQVLLNHGAQLEIRCQDGFTPLMEAVFHNNGPMIRFLLNAGADKYVRTIKAVSVRVKKDWTDWRGHVVSIPKDATLLDIAQQFEKRVAENILINEAGFK